jgi:hypothetical protein
VDGWKVLCLVVAGRLPRSSAVSTEDRDLARRMGETGQQHVRAHYSWPGIAAQMEALRENVGV